MKISVLNRRVPRLAGLTDRQLNHLILRVAMILIIGIPTATIVYVIDRATASGPTFAERQVATLEAAVKENPNLLSLRLQLAGAYGAANRFDDGIAQLTAVLEASPDDKTALVNRGDFYLTVGKLDEAAADYARVIELSKDGEFANVDMQLHQAYYSLGAIQIQQGKPAEAVRNLTAALVIRGTDADTLNLLGAAHLANGEAQEAADALRAAVLFVPTGWPDPYATLQNAYDQLGRSEEATWAGAMASFAAGNPTSARQILSGLIDGPAATDAYLGLALVDEELGDRASALTEYQAVLDREPDNFIALDGVARLAGPTAPQGAGAAPTPDSLAN